MLSGPSVAQVRMGGEEILHTVLMLFALEIEEMGALALPARDDADIGGGSTQQELARRRVDRRVTETRSGAFCGNHVRDERWHEFLDRRDIRAKWRFKNGCAATASVYTASRRNRGWVQWLC